MAQPAIRNRQEPVATPGAAIDRAHLARMTFGETALERELLELFDRQAELLVARIALGDAQTAAALAHTLKGSAVGVGAMDVAAAAAAIEQGSTAERRAALAAAVECARAEIAVILR
jgi:HPt (histidine-containing phosphotransfer) domain-containing protein